jgi:hypothetical protein
MQKSKPAVGWFMFINLCMMWFFSLLGLVITNHGNIISDVLFSSYYGLMVILCWKHDPFPQAFYKNQITYWAFIITFLLITVAFLKY